MNSNSSSILACFPLDKWQYAQNKPEISGAIRCLPEDFQVTEVLGFSPCGDGSHLWAKITKNGLNTQEVVRLLATRCTVRPGEVGYSGLKDRHGITCQWFSVPAGKDPERQSGAISKLCAEHQQLSVSQIVANTGKLKRGVHRANEFKIVVRNLDGNHDLLDQMLAVTGHEGVPNYFGPQRFGRNNKNVLTAIRLFTDVGKKLDRNARGLALSSARSWIFNQVLSQRILNNNWNSALIGDALQLDGSNAYFIHDGSDDSIIDRIGRHDLHPTGPLWGAGELATREGVADFESSIVDDISILPRGLESAGLKQQRRALRVVPGELTWSFPERSVLKISFSLPSGSYATAVLRQLVEVGH